MRGDDRVSRLHARRDQGQPEGFRSRRAPDGVGRSRQRSNFTLQRLDFRTKNETLRIAYARDGRQHFFANAIILAAQVKQWNRPGRCGSWCC